MFFSGVARDPHRSGACASGLTSFHMQLGVQSVAVVTGAGNGVGQAIACHLAKCGCRLVLVDIDHEGLDRTRKLLADCTASFHALDVAKRPAIESLAVEIANEWGCVDLLVNNAGVSLADRFEKSDITDFEWLMGVNFWGVIYTCRSFLPLLREAKEARICNILSGFALIGFPTKSAYVASKFAVRGFSESLQMELHAANVGVTCIYLGAVNSDLVRHGRACDSAKQQAEAEFLARNGIEPGSSSAPNLSSNHRRAIACSNWLEHLLGRCDGAAFSSSHTKNCRDRQKQNSVRIKMTKLYAIAGWAIIDFGVVHMLATFRLFHAFNNAALWFFSGGIAIALTGVLNLLQRAYGHVASGLRNVCIGTNIVMTIFAFLSGVVTHASLAQFALVLGLLGGTTTLSLSRTAMKQPRMH
jgi:short-subunit dehydrogenase